MRKRQLMRWFLVFLKWQWVGLCLVAFLYGCYDGRSTSSLVGPENDSGELLDEEEDDGGEGDDDDGDEGEGDDDDGDEGEGNQDDEGGDDEPVIPAYPLDWLGAYGQRNGNRLSWIYPADETFETMKELVIVRKLTNDIVNMNDGEEVLRTTDLGITTVVDVGLFYEQTYYYAAYVINEEGRSSVAVHAQGTPWQNDLFESGYNEESGYISNPEFDGSFFGRKVALDGDQLIALSNFEGAVYANFYQRFRDGWVFEQAINVTGDLVANDILLNSIYLKNDRLIIGTPAYPTGGSVSIYKKHQNRWLKEDVLYPFTADNNGFGGCLDYEPESQILVVCHYADSGDASSTMQNPNTNLGTSGAVYVYKWEAPFQWEQISYLKAHNAAPGMRFGVSVDLKGNHLVVGASVEDGDASSTIQNPNTDAMDAGAAYVFEQDLLDESQWTLTDYLKASDAESTALFGFRVRWFTDGLLVSAPYYRNSELSDGKLYIFKKGGSAWVEETIIESPSDQGPTETFGVHIDFDAGLLAVGAESWPDDENSKIFLYSLESGQWSAPTTVIRSEQYANEKFGLSFDLDRGTLVVGSEFVRHNGGGRGTVLVFD